MVSESDLIPTLSSRIRNKTNQSIPLQVVEFKTHQKKQTEVIESHKSENKKTEEVDMNKARFEIMKFGMKRMSSREKEKTKDIIAVELGARPAKNSYINYKELIKKRKIEKEHEKEEKKLFEINRKTIGKKSVKKINRNDSLKKKMMRKKSGIIEQYGKTARESAKSELVKHLPRVLSEIDQKYEKTNGAMIKSQGAIPDTNKAQKNTQDTRNLSFSKNRYNT